jgi:hypothetical protein
MPPTIPQQAILWEYRANYPQFVGIAQQGERHPVTTATEQTSGTAILLADRLCMAGATGQSLGESQQAFSPLWRRFQVELLLIGQRGHHAASDRDP